MAVSSDEFGPIFLIYFLIPFEKLDSSTKTPSIFGQHRYEVVLLCVRVWLLHVFQIHSSYRFPSQDNLKSVIIYSYNIPVSAINYAVCFKHPPFAPDNIKDQFNNY